MDPYLEHPELWPDVHNGLVAALRERLGPVLRPRYVVRLEERIYQASIEGLVFLGRPDVSVVGRRGVSRPGSAAAALAVAAVEVEVPVPDIVRETWLEVRRVTDGDVVTVLEVLSPTNKAQGEGRRLFEAKRLATLGTRTSWVEIDLLRAGEPMPVHGAPPTGDYRVLVSRGDRRPRADLFVFSVRDPIPRFRLPLRPGDEEPEVDLGAVLADLYDHAAYDLSIDYAADAAPPLAAEDAAWARGLCVG